MDGTTLGEIEGVIEGSGLVTTVSGVPVVMTVGGNEDSTVGEIADGATVGSTEGSTEKGDSLGTALGPVVGKLKGVTVTMGTSDGT